MKLFQKKFLHIKFIPSWIGLGLMRFAVYFPKRIQSMLGMGLGMLMRPFMGSRAHIARTNLAMCFPELSDAQREQILKQNMRILGMMIIEMGISWWMSDERLLKRVRYQGMENLEQAQQKGKGVILLTGHFTSMEIGGRFIMMKTPAYLMFRQLKNPLLNAAMVNARERVSGGILMHDDIRSMVRALRKNNTVWYAPDQDFGRRNSLFAKFFGHTAATIPATSKLAKMTGATVVPFVPKRELDGRYTITIDAAWEGFPSGDETADAQRINDWIEQKVRDMPEQYYWVHRRFKTQPDQKKATLYK